MSLNDEQVESIVATRQMMNGGGSTRKTRVPILKSATKKKQTRKVSAYQKRFGINLKKLKRKHPRTDISVLMKKSHRITRREMK